MRIMAIDYGDARSGAAFSDITGTLAGESLVLKSPSLSASGEKQTAAKLAALAKERGAEEIVVGYPKNMNGTLGPRAEKSERLAEALRQATGLPVFLWDERLTTVDAHRILSENSVYGKKRKATVDAVAAVLILEGYLASKKR